MAAEGHSVIVITHKLHEVMAVADRVTVLRGGRAIATVPTGEATVERLAAMMVGRDVELERRQERSSPVGEVVLQAEGLTAAGDRGFDALREVSLEVRAGEVLGVAGVAGNGQRELAEAITGLRPLTRRGRHASTAVGCAAAIPARRSRRASHTSPRTGFTRASRRASASRRTSSSSRIGGAASPAGRSCCSDGSASAPSS